MSQLKVGDKAPDFTLLYAPEKSVTLSEELEKGPVILVFYPADFSSVCQEELCHFRDSLSVFNQLNANVFGVSVDGIFSHGAFAKQNNIGFLLLSDWEKNVIQAYDIIYPNLAGMKDVAKRSVFVIDTGGIIRYIWIAESPRNLPPIDNVRSAVENLK